MVCTFLLIENLWTTSQSQFKDKHGQRFLMSHTILKFYASFAMWNGSAINTVLLTQVPGAITSMDFEDFKSYNYGPATYQELKTE